MTYRNGSLASEIRPTSPNLLLIRHGITDMAGTLCGQSDPPLNEEGRTQVKALVSLLGRMAVNRLYSSDLQRAVQTALPLADKWQIGGISRKDLREISFGDWEGKRWANIRATLPDRAAMDSTPELCAPRGETFAAFRDRVVLAFREIMTDSSGGCTAIVTHLGVIRVVLSEVFSDGWDWFPDRRIDHCAVYLVDLKKGSLEPLTISTQTDTSADRRAASAEPWPRV